MTNSRQSVSGFRYGFWLATATLIVLLGVLFFNAFKSDYTVFSNDGPYGQMVPKQNRLPAILTGLWQDLNWLGGPAPAPAPNATTALRLITSPLVFSKIFAPFSLFVVGICAWICFRQYKFSPLACLLVAIAAALNSDFVGTAAWGVCSQPVAFGMNFLALGALADTTSPRRWLRVVLAGFCVGLGVMEAYDIGALFSLFVAAFVVVQSLVADGPIAKRIANSISRLAVVSVCAALIAAAALMTLIGTQIKGVAGVGQDAESKAARWNFAVQYSIPKIETLGMIVPGLFGLRGDSPDGKAYWGRAGSYPSWDEFVESGGKAGQPQYAFRAGAGSNYAGVLVILVAIFGVAQSFRRQGGPFNAMHRKLIWFWLAAFVIGLLLMWGRFAPFYQFFYALPYASTIRNPSKFHHIAQWALLILFAYGAEALSRIGLNSTATAASSLGAQWKSSWTKAASFDRKWIAFSAIFIGLFAVGWLGYAASRAKLTNHLTNLYFLSQGIPLEKAPSPSDALLDYARATAQFSIGQVGRATLFLVPTVGLVALILSGYFRGSRAKIGGALLLILLVADLFPIGRAWTVFVNWKEKYESNSVIEFLAERPYEHRVALFNVNARGLPEQLQQRAGLLSQLYTIEWTQHLFPYNNIQTLDIIQEPRVPADKAAYEAVMHFAPPVRKYELSNTRYLLAPTGLLDVFNQQLDRKHRFGIAHQFDFAAKPGTSGQSFEEITTVSHTNGQFSIYDFAGALPRAKLFTNWKVSTNPPPSIEAWSKMIQTNVPTEWASALASQSPADLATLHELANPEFDPARTVLLTQPMPVALGTNENVGEVKFVSYAPKHIVLDAKAATPSVLLLTDKFDPNWHVTVDGQPAPLLRANFIERAVFIEKPGEHRIEFRFQPPTTGLYVSLAMIVIGLALLGYVLISERRSASAAGT